MYSNRAAHYLYLIFYRNKFTLYKTCVCEIEKVTINGQKELITSLCSKTFIVSRSESCNQGAAAFIASMNLMQPLPGRSPLVLMATSSFLRLSYLLSFALPSKFTSSRLLLSFLSKASSRALHQLFLLPCHQRASDGAALHTSGAATALPPRTSGSSNTPFLTQTAPSLSLPVFPLTVLRRLGEVSRCPRRCKVSTSARTSEHQSLKKRNRKILGHLFYGHKKP